MKYERFTWKTEKLQHSDDEVIMIVDTANNDWKGHILNIVGMLNEQDRKIKVLQNSCEIMNRRVSELCMSIRSSDELDKEKLEALKDAETEIKLLNSYLVENGLAEDFIRWKKMG